MPAISVIMPVYNSEKYLVAAIESVLNQTFEDFELLLIDDGSRDSSGDICDNYAQRDKRVSVIHKTNGGICTTRNVGISLARGKYISFIDNDDECDKDLLKDNYLLAERYAADVVKFGREFINMRGKVVIAKEVSTYDKIRVVKKEELSTFFEEFMYVSGSINIWNALYNREFLCKIGLKFNTTHRYGHEDIEFNLIMYPQIKVMVLNPRVYYKWIRRVGHSSSSKFARVQFDSLFRVLKLKKQLLINFNSSKQGYSWIMMDQLTFLLFYICHANSDLSLIESEQLLKEFYKIAGKIDSRRSFTWKQKISATFYNAGYYKMLILMKKGFNMIRNKEDL